MPTACSSRTWARRRGPIKLLAGGEIKVALTIHVDATSESARKAVEAAGGKVQLPEPKSKERATTHA